MRFRFNLRRYICMIHLYFVYKRKATFESPTTNTVLKNQSILFLLHFIDGRKSIGAFHSGHDTHLFYFSTS